MEHKRLDRKAISSWRLGRLVSFLFILLACGGVSIFISIIPELGWYRWLVWTLTGLLLLYKLLGIVIYPLIEYRQWGYQITEEKVDIRHGIFFVTNTIIPIIRIQHITVNQGPINRRFGLYKVEISLASDSFEIECLNKQVADEIAEYLKEKLYVRLEQHEEEQA